MDELTPFARWTGPDGLVHQPGLDGLRGLAVAAVVAFHLGIDEVERRLPRRVAVLHAVGRLDRHADPQRDRHHRALLARRVLAAAGAAAAPAGAGHAGRRRRRPAADADPRGDDPRRRRRQRPQRRQLALPRRGLVVRRPVRRTVAPCCTSGAWRSRSSSTSSSDCSPCSSPGAPGGRCASCSSSRWRPRSPSFVVPIVVGAGVDRDLLRQRHPRRRADDRRRRGGGVRCRRGAAPLVLDRMRSVARRDAAGAWR